MRPFTTRGRRSGARPRAQYRAKEQELLQQRLGELQQKLSSLKVAESEDNGLIGDAQRKEIEGFRGQLLDTRRELRDVQLDLRKDIEDLRDRIRFFNIAAMPILVAVLAIVVGWSGGSAIAAASTSARLSRGAPMSPKSFAVLDGATALSLGLAAGRWSTATPGRQRPGEPGHVRRRCSTR